MLPEFRVRIHASGILTRDLPFRILGPGMLAPGFWSGPRYTAGFPQASRSFSATCAAFPQPSSGFAASQRFFHGLTRQFPGNLPGSPPGGTRRSPGSPLSTLPGGPPAITRPPGYLMSWRLTFLSEKEKVLPTPNSLRTVIRSPCASMMCLTMASPSPVPPCSRERPLSVR